jgi:hypothetical protein
MSGRRVRRWRGDKLGTPCNASSPIGSFKENTRFNGSGSKILMQHQGRCPIRPESAPSAFLAFFDDHSN